MSDLFVAIPKDLKIKKKKDNDISIITDPVIYSNSDNPEITFILDKFYTKDYLQKFVNNILKQEKHDITFQFLYCFQRKSSQKEMKTDIGWFYYDNSANLSKYIKNNSKIITIGSSIYSLTYGNTDLNVEAFYDFIFNKTYFYTPLYNSIVFPIDHLYEWNGKDNFKRFFALKQIKSCIEYSGRPLRIPVLKSVVVSDTEKFFNNFKNTVGYISADTETSGFNFLEDEVYCLTLAFEEDPYTGYFLKWTDIDIKLLDEFLQNKKIVYQGGKFDVKFFKRYGIKNYHIDEDTLQLAHVLNEMRSNSLKTLSWVYTCYGGYEQALENFKRRYRKSKYNEIDDNILQKYACNDASITMLVWIQQIKQLKWIDENFKEPGKWKLEDYYRKIVIPAVNLFVDIEFDGVYFDWDGLGKLSNRLKKEIQDKKVEISKELCLESKKTVNILSFCDDIELDWFTSIDDENEFNIEEVKFEMNVDSNDIMGELLEKKGLPNHGRNVKGIYNVNDETLKKWSKQGYKIADLIIELHKLSVLFNSFVGCPQKRSGYFKYRFKDNMLHPSFGVCMTNSGRHRCKAPNLQNTVQRGYLAKELKSLFIPPSIDYEMISIDYSGFQLSIGAILSGDREMWNTFTSCNPDLHSKTGYSVLNGMLPDTNISYIEFLELVENNNPIAKYIRQKSKAINFQLEFGASSLNFAKTVIETDWSIEECDSYIRKNNLKGMEINLLGILYGKLEDKDKEEPSMFASVLNKEEFAKCWAVATHIRKKHFETYSGLFQWIEDTKIEAKEKGYVKSVFGSFRRLPQLLYIGKDEEMGKVKNLLNISLNSPVQSFEISVITLAMERLRLYKESNNLDIRTWNMVHDSNKFYVNKKDKEHFINNIPNIFTKELPEFRGLPIRVDFD